MLELNRIYCGDCLDLMREMPDKSVDLVLCDLPYGTTACAWDVIIPFEPLWEQYIRICKDNAAILLTASQPFTTDLINSNRKMFKYELIWYKDKPADFGNNNVKPLRYHENICVFYKSHPKYNRQFTERKGTGDSRAKYPVNFKQGSDHKFGMKDKILHYNNTGRTIGSVIEISTGMRGAIKHPTAKPIELFEHLIKTYSNEGDIVLDNCMGSGTTCVACKKLGRNYIGIEKEPAYIAIAEKRLEKVNNHKITDFFGVAP